MVHTSLDAEAVLVIDFARLIDCQLKKVLWKSKYSHQMRKNVLFYLG